MRVAFGTVVYKLAYRYAEDFINSMNNQVAENFDVILYNDDLEDKNYNYIVESLKFNVVQVKNYKKKTIPETRIDLITIAKKENYDLLILGDFDDVASENRIKSHIEGFDFSFSFFYNDLYRLDNGHFFLNNLPEKTLDANSLLRYNYLGFTNTALNLHCLDQSLLDLAIKRQTLVFDWIFFSLMLNRGLLGKKIKNCKTLYRIHDNNIAGDNNCNLKKIMDEINVKVNHYFLLSDINPIYARLYEHFERLQTKLERNELELNIEPKSSDGFWWSIISNDLE